ncbi:MAG TPA: Clp protease N-terminal domain-containing protein [Pseudonocardiaceae bacterium]|jgi:hypothetical protein|nr:Clp protease N-terminal domain-containing protein [Pseudonocardiaceae bacterium]
MRDVPDLDDLVAFVDLTGAARDHDPLRQIEAAESLAADLHRLGDRLVGHYVERARVRGYTWTQIGARAGLTRQGAQQRHAPHVASLSMADLAATGLLDRFTRRCTDALDRAARHARRHRQPVLDTGHILLGVLDDADSIAVQAIRVLEADPDVIRAGLELPARDGIPPDPVTVGPNARRALDAALAEARLLNHPAVGTEHLLLALLREPTSTVGGVLTAQGVTRETATAVVQRIVLDHYRSRE